MIGGDLPVSGLSGASSGGEIINGPLRADGRPFSTIRYFSDACREAIDYSSPVTIDAETAPRISMRFVHVFFIRL